MKNKLLGHLQRISTDKLNDKYRNQASCLHTNLTKTEGVEYQRLDRHVRLLTRKLSFAGFQSVNEMLFLLYCRSDFEGLTPDYQALEKSDKTGRILEVILTMKGSKDITDKHGNVYDFVSRNFSPWVGIPEDPVTGKANLSTAFCPNLSQISVCKRRIITCKQNETRVSKCLQPCTRRININK